eukprot:scaffold3763_cov165-Amphora_coffeaeformis.AAC.22
MTNARMFVLTSSLVSVPVLSKQQISTCPAQGIRYSSVQYTCARRTSATNEFVTASDNSMGSSGGTTDVTMRMTCKMRRKRFRRSSCHPSYKT